MAAKPNELHRRREQRVRTKLRKTTERLRLSVFRSNNHIYAQIIDDKSGTTLVAASSLEKEVSGKGKSSGNKEMAQKVGRTVAEKAKKVNIEEVVFDRGGYLFHGRVKALAEAAREAGLKF